MRRAKIYVDGQLAAYFVQDGLSYDLCYVAEYNGLPISLTLPVQKESYHFEQFPPFFDGLLPEGLQLEGLLKYAKLDRSDYFEQLLCVGHDLVGNVTVESDT